MTPDTYLVASVLALGCGPALDIAGSIGRTGRWLAPMLNGFVMAFIAALVFLDLLPHAIHEIGPWALGAAVLGFFLVQRLESASHPHTETNGEHTQNRSIPVFILLGLALHAATDGAAMAGAAHAGTESLPIAVMVHRLPVSVLIWWMAGGRARPWRGLLGLGVIAAATVAGYGGATSMSEWTHGQFALVEAAVAGAVLHVLRGPHGVSPNAPPAPVIETVGVAIAVVAFAMMPSGFDAAKTSTATASTLLQLALISAPALVVGYAIAGFLGTTLPAASLRWVAQGGPWSQSLRGTLLGLPLPICSCGVIPVYASLHRAGVPASAGLAFLIATPELGIESFLLSYPLLGAEMTMSRLAAAAVLAIGVGAVVGRTVGTPQIKEKPCCTRPCRPEPPSFIVRLRRALDVGFSELLQSTGPWIVAGLAIAALFQPDMLQGVAHTVPGAWSVALFAVIGVPLYVCASGATPLAAAFLVAGVSPGAVLAFLLAGPATNVTTFGLLKQLHGSRTAVLFGTLAVGSAIGFGLLLNVLWSPAWPVPHVAPHTDAIGVVHWVSLALIGVAGLRLMLLRGPLALVQSLFTMKTTPTSSPRRDTPKERGSAPASCCCESEAIAS